MGNERKYDSTMLRAYQRCPFYYKLRWIDGWQAEIESDSLIFGSAIHKCLLAHYSGRDDEIEKIIEEMPKLEDTKRTKERAKAIVSGYLERYKEEPYKIISVERKFEIDMENGSMFFGRIDLIVKWDKLMYVKDHKTTRSIALSFFEGFRPNLQMDGYCYACKRIYGECAGVIINGILIGQKIDFARNISARTNEEIREFEKIYLSTVNNIEQSCGEFPKYIGNCNVFYTNCLYKNVCLFNDYNGLKKEVVKDEKVE